MLTSPVSARLSALLLATSGIAAAQPAVDIGVPTPNWQLGANVPRASVAGTEATANGQTGLVSVEGGTLVAVSPFTFTSGAFWVDPEIALGFYNNSPAPAFYGGSKLILHDATVLRTQANALAASGLANDFLNPQLADYIVAGTEVELDTKAHGTLEALYVWQQNDWSDYTTGQVSITSDQAFAFTGSYQGGKLGDVFGHWVVQIGDKTYVSDEKFALGTSHGRFSSQALTTTNWNLVTGISDASWDGGLQSADTAALLTTQAVGQLDLTGVTGVGVYLEALIRAGLSSAAILRMLDFEFSPGGLGPVVPEPSTYAMCAGVVALALALRRRR